MKWSTVKLNEIKLSLPKTYKNGRQIRGAKETAVY